MKAKVKDGTRSTCRRCEADIEYMHGVGWNGWVDSLSGDEGGTYDICPDNEDDMGPHDPVPTGG